MKKFSFLIINSSLWKNFCKYFLNGRITRNPIIKPKVLRNKSSTSKRRYAHGKIPKSAVPWIVSKKSEIPSPSKIAWKNLILKSIPTKNPIGIMRKILKITWKSALFLNIETLCFSAKVRISSMNWNGVSWKIWIPFLASQNAGVKSGNGNKTNPKAKKKKKVPKYIPIFWKIEIYFLRRKRWTRMMVIGNVKRKIIPHCPIGPIKYDKYESIKIFKIIFLVANQSAFCQFFSKFHSFRENNCSPRIRDVRKTAMDASFWGQNVFSCR